MTKAANQVEKTMGTTKAGKARKDLAAKTETIRIKNLLVAAKAAAAKALPSKISATFSLASLLKSFGAVGQVDFSALLIFGKVITPSAIWAKRLLRRQAANRGNSSATATPITSNPQAATRVALAQQTATALQRLNTLAPTQQTPNSKASSHPVQKFSGTVVTKSAPVTIDAATTTAAPNANNKNLPL